MQEGYPVIVEAHMNNMDYISKMTETAKKYDYETILLSPTVDVEIIFKRGEKRSKETGKRFVVQGALQHHKEFENNWDSYTKMFDVAIRLDNNEENAPPYPIAIAVNGELSILDEAAYEKARRKIDINTSGKTAAEALPEESRYCGSVCTQKDSMEESNGKGEGGGFAAELRGKREITRSIIEGISNESSRHR